MRNAHRGPNERASARFVAVVLGCVLVSVLSSCRNEEGADARREVVDPPMPAGTRWAPSDERAPRTVLESVAPAGSWKLTVELPRGHEAQRILVFGPGPDFDEIATRDLKDGESTTKFRFDFTPDDIPASASEIYVAVRYVDTTLAVGQALIR